jgi:hypothetical protein
LNFDVSPIIFRNITKISKEAKSRPAAIKQSENQEQVKQVKPAESKKERNLQSNEKII